MRFVFTTRGRLLLDIVLISMFSGYLVRIYAWRTILGRNGVLNAALLELGVISEPITFLIYSNWATSDHPGRPPHPALAPADLRLDVERVA